jgi:hypothetical protein
MSSLTAVTARNSKEIIMKTITAAVLATLVLASAAMAAPGAIQSFYPDGHESYTGTSGG